MKRAALHSSRKMVHRSHLTIDAIQVLGCSNLLIEADEVLAMPIMDMVDVLKRRDMWDNFAYHCDIVIIDGDIYDEYGKIE